MLSTYFTEMVLLLLEGGGGGPSEVHIRIPYENLFQGVCVGKLVLLLLYKCDFPGGGGRGLLPIYDIVRMCGPNSPLF